MTAHVNISGTWKNITDIYENVSGTWKRVKHAYVNVSGVWKLLYSVIKLSGGSAVDVEVGATADASITVGSDGSITYVGNNSSSNPTDEYYRFRPSTGIGAAYWVRLTKTSGSDPTTGPALATWHQINTDRSWAISRSTAGTTSGVYTLEISPDSGGAQIVASGSYTISATRV